MTFEMLITGIINTFAAIAVVITVSGALWWHDVLAALICRYLRSSSDDV